jgi:hypothetical protein
VAALVATACGATPRAAGNPGNAGSPGGDGGHRGDAHVEVGALGAIRVWSWFDLPREDPRSHQLSGIAWDAATRRLWAVQDATRDLVSLVPDADLRSFRFGPVVRLGGTVEADREPGRELDLEGIAIVPGGFVVAGEIGPRVLSVDRRGALVREVPLPRELAEARENKSLESLGVTDDGRVLFTMNEQALPRDGEPPTRTEGSRLRLVRIDLRTGSATEYAYLTDPAPPHAHGPHDDYGVSEIAVLGDGDLLVLERGFSRGVGNTVRIYRVELDAASSCADVDRLTAATPPLPKRLVVDLERLPAAGLPTPRQAQPTPLLENYEGLTVGPRLPNGQRSLILVSDDNARSDQVARLLVLAFAGP